jgi:Ca-activated chloride channel family protein
LSLPALDAPSFAALPFDQAVHDRMQEVEFAQASQALRAMVQQGDTNGARKLIKQLQTRFGTHPWLQDKLQQLRELAERDPDMMVKEVRFSAMRMWTRLSSQSEARFSGDETGVDIPAFLRKKSQEGRGKQKPGSPQP